MKVQKIKLSPYDYTWLVLDNNYLPIKPITEFIRYLNDELKPMGIILCAGKDHDDIEYLEMDKTGIHVAQYLTEMPPKEILETHLRRAMAIAKENYLKKSLIEE